MMRRSSTPGRCALLATLAILFISCSADGDESGGEDSPPGDLVQATRLTEVAEADALLTPGLYAMGFASDLADSPMVVIDVPAGYTGRGDGYEISAMEGSFRHFDTWTVADVARRPCGGTTWADPGPSVDDLAEALAALPVWETTEPAPVTIGGYEGVFMELNVPATIPARCAGTLDSWREHTGGTQGIGEGKVQRLWIVDVDGQRLMLVAGFFPGPDGPSRRQIDEMTQMAEGATFVDADQIAP